MTLSGYIYTCSAGESWDLIARKIYGDEKYAAELLSANPALSGKMIFTGGEEVEMPVLETGKDKYDETIGAAPWKE